MYGIRVKICVLLKIICLLNYVLCLGKFQNSTQGDAETNVTYIVGSSLTNTTSQNICTTDETGEAATCECDENTRNMELTNEHEAIIQNATSLKIKSCDTITIYTPDEVEYKWDTILFDNIKNLDLDSVYLPTSLTNISISNSFIYILQQSNFKSFENIQSFSIYESTINSVETDAFKRISVNNTKFVNVYFKSISQNSFFFDEDKTNSTKNSMLFENCTIDKITENAIIIENIHEIKFINCKFPAYIPNYAIQLHVENTVKITKSYFKHFSTRALKISAKNVTITNNQISNIDGNGIQIKRNLKAGNISINFADNEITNMEANAIKIECPSFNDTFKIAGNILPCQGSPLCKEETSSIIETYRIISSISNNVTEICDLLINNKCKDKAGNIMSILDSISLSPSCFVVDLQESRFVEEKCKTFMKQRPSILRKAWGINKLTDKKIVKIITSTGNLIHAEILNTIVFVIFAVLLKK